MLKNSDINIRDPFVLTEGGKYYMYGTRAKDFGRRVGGFDVYVGTDLEHWSDPIPVFASAPYGMNDECNWAPEVHRYNGKCYAFATFQQPNGRRGTYSLVSESPLGPFVPNSEGPLTPPEWYSLDGTLWVEDGAPYLVFCHEHVQIMNGTVCRVALTPDLKRPVGEPEVLFCGSEAWGVPENPEGRYVTDGPFLFRGENGRLYMIWSTCPPEGYYQGLCVSESGKIAGPWKQLPPLYTKDGGHGMLFRDLSGGLRLTLHSPNASGHEHPVFFRVTDSGERLEIRE